MNLSLLREMRKKKGLTQESVAQQMGYSNKSGYSMLETGQVQITLEKALRLKKILSLSDDEFRIIFLPN